MHPIHITNITYYIYYIQSIIYILEHVFRNKRFEQSVFIDTSREIVEGIY